MKKFILKLIAIVLVLTPLTVKAVSIEDYNSLNLDQALTMKEIDKKYKELKTNDKQVTIYIFFGYSCPHCEELLEYLNDIYEDYSDKINIVLFETYQDSKNAKLLADVAEFFGYGAQEYGVPFMIIGEKEFVGYGAAKNTDIENAIKEAYDTKKEDRYDLFVEMSKPKEENTTSTGVGLGGIIIIAVVSVGTVILYDTIRFNSIQNEIRELDKKRK